VTSKAKEAIRLKKKANKSSFMRNGLLRRLVESVLSSCKRSRSPATPQPFKTCLYSPRGWEYLVRDHPGGECLRIGVCVS